MRGDGQSDLDHFVVVPADPAPIVPLASVRGQRSDVDEALDDLFGEVDDDGPGATDAVLLTGGVAAIIAAQVVALPAVVLVGGLGSLGLGAVLPIRSGLRRLRRRRQRAHIDELIGTGLLLDVRHDVVTEVVRAHQAIFATADGLNDVQALRTRNVAHALVTEVVTLLDAHRLIEASEVAYATERRDALRNLLAVATATAAGERSSDRDRNAQVQARLEVEATSSHSALREASELTDDLLNDPNV